VPKKSGLETEKADRRVSILAYQGPPEVLDWFNEFSETFGGIPLTNLVDLAMRDFAEKRGFRPMPRRRARRRA
jgi:hypothetical protein